MCGCLSHAPYWGPDVAHNPGMCPDWESNRQPLGSQASTQSTEPHQPGEGLKFLKLKLMEEIIGLYLSYLGERTGFISSKKH